MKINPIAASRLRNDAHFQFHSDFRGLVVKYGAEKLKIKPQFDEWQKFYEREDEAINRISKSALTQQIREADLLRDDMYSGMAGITNFYLKHYDSEVRAAARRLKIVFDTYGNISKKPLREQTSAAYNILQELRGKYAADCAKVKIDDWVSRLAQANETFNKLTNERFDEAAARNGVSMKDARRKLDGAYKRICEIINVYVLLEGAQNYEQFIKTLNVIIEKYFKNQAKYPRSSTSR